MFKLPIRKMMYLVNQKEKNKKEKEKVVKLKKKVHDYEIIQEPIILLTDIFCQFWPYDLS